MTAKDFFERYPDIVEHIKNETPVVIITRHGDKRRDVLTGFDYCNTDGDVTIYSKESICVDYKPIKKKYRVKSAYEIIRWMVKQNWSFIDGSFRDEGSPNFTDGMFAVCGRVLNFCKPWEDGKYLGDGYIWLSDWLEEVEE